MTKTRVLVVEDYEPFSRILQLLLEEEPRTEIVAIASDGLTALDAAEDLHPDLILLDIGLPHLSGIETARRLRDLSPASIILFVTSEIALEFVNQAFELGARGYVLKIDAVSELSIAINTVLDGDVFVSSGCRQFYLSTMQKFMTVADVTV